MNTKPSEAEIKARIDALKGDPILKDLRRKLAEDVIGATQRTMALVDGPNLEDKMGILAMEAVMTTIINAYAVTKIAAVKMGEEVTFEEFAMTTLMGIIANRAVAAEADKTIGRKIAEVLAAAQR